MTIKHIVNGVILILLLSGCSSLPAIKDDKAIGHIISIGRDGELEEIKKDQKIRLDPGEENIEKKADFYDQVLTGIRNYPKNANGEIEVLIYVHGGLNTKKNSLKRAQEKYKAIKYAGVENKYPIFVNWRSGPITTYSSHLARIRQGEVSNTAWLTSPVYLLTDIANSLVNVPKSWLVNGEHAIKSAVFRDDDYLENYRDAKNGVFYTGSEEGFTTWGRNLQWLVTAPAKLVSTPFTYTVARPAWDVMLRRTNTPFYTPNDLQNKSHDIEPADNPGSGALYRFLTTLDNEISTKNLPVKVTLVGHSMGAIVVNKILSLDLDIPYKNIIHMASADSISNMFEHVIPYVSEHPDTKFYSLSLHPENEDREISAKGLTPSGSLLVWIDNMFTTPETVMDKRSGRWENMNRVIPLIPDEAKNRMHFKIFGLNDSKEKGGYVIEPQTHGDFGDMKFWTKSTWWK